MSKAYHPDATRGSTPRRLPHTEEHLNQICDGPVFRQQGIGMDVIRNVVAELRGRGTDRITVAQWGLNSVSKAFFAADGFVPILIKSEFNPP